MIHLSEVYEGNNPKISIIIPVYNSAEFLAICLESVISQTLDSIEVICIDDGSTDDSYKILDSYTKRYSIIKAYRRSNEGAAAARNFGIDQATGQYISFMDADDYYYSDSVLEELYYAAKRNCAKICGGSLCTDIKGKIERANSAFEFQEEGFINFRDYQYDFGFTRFIYDRLWLLDNQIYFPPYRYFEDPVFFVKAMIAADKFYAVNRYVYCYRQGYKRQLLNEQQLVDLIKGMNELKNISAKYGYRKLEHECEDQFNRFYKKSLYYSYVSGCCSWVNYMNESEVTNLLQEFKQSLDEEETFLKRITECEGVYIYGAGNRGKDLYEYLHKRDLLNNVKGYIVSNKDKEPIEDMYGFKIFDIKEVNLKPSELIIIAVGNKLQGEIVRQLDQRGIGKYISILDFDKIFIFV